MNLNTLSEDLFRPKPRFSPFKATEKHSRSRRAAKRLPSGSQSRPPPFKPSQGPLPDGRRAKGHPPFRSFRLLPGTASRGFHPATGPRHSPSKLPEASLPKGPLQGPKAPPVRLLEGTGLLPLQAQGTFLLGPRSCPGGPSSPFRRSPSQAHNQAGSGIGIGAQPGKVLRLPSLAGACRFENRGPLQDHPPFLITHSLLSINHPFRP